MTLTGKKYVVSPLETRIPIEIRERIYSVDDKTRILIRRTYARRFKVVEDQSRRLEYFKEEEGMIESVS